MKPLWKVKGFFNRTSWKVPDVQVTAGPREDGSRTTVAQLAELGTQNQQLHQALQQVQQQQSQQQGLVQALSDLPQSLACYQQQDQHEPIQPWWTRKVWESLHR